MTAKTASRASLTVLPALLLVMTGCSSNDVSDQAIIHNLSPELMATTERPIDVQRHVDQTSDVNSRLFWDDMGRAFYTEQPSRLSPMPVTGTSGIPR